MIDGADLGGALSYPALPAQYNCRAPGISMELWPVREDSPGGCENYGWGATFPALMIRNLIGFREVNSLDQGAFLMAPALPASFCTAGPTYGMWNLDFWDARINVDYTVGDEDQIHITLAGPLTRAQSICVETVWSLQQILTPTLMIG